MASFSDCPLEITAVIIESLQDDFTALKACSMTCRSFLPFCRAFIFRFIDLTTRIVSFGRLLDSNPSISDYVHNLVYQLQYHDLDHSVPRVLIQFHRLHFFRLIGDEAHWNALPQPFRDSILHIIRLPSLTSLDISYFTVFPITIFSRCLNLTSLVLTNILDDSVDEYRSILNVVPQLSSFAFDPSIGKYVGKLVGAHQSNGPPILGFHNLRSLRVTVDKDKDFAVIHVLLKATNKLETLECIGVFHNCPF